MKETPVTKPAGDEAGDIREVVGADGVRLRYEVTGAGDPILLLHGGFAGRDAWRRIRPDLAAHFRLILRDLRGNNGAEARVPAGYRIETTEVDDTERVLNAEGIERVDIIAHSVGAAFGFAFARAHPERVRRLVFIEPAIFSLLPPDLRAENRAESEAWIRIAESGDPVGAIHALISTSLGKGWQDRVPPAWRAQIEAPAPIFTAHVRAVIDVDITTDDLCRVGAVIPTLYIRERHSPRYFAAIMDVVAATVPNAQIVMVEDADHAPHLQQPAEVSAAILSFLQAPGRRD